MKKMGKKETFLLGILLFSMFFGSGNLIFPPFLGFEAGTETWKGLIGFGITAVLFPVLGVIAIARTGDLMKLSSRVSRRFALIFSILVFLALGPGLAIPRNAAVSFEMAVVPFMEEVPTWLRIAYSAVFFGVALLLSLHPESLVDWLGKILGPILIGLMVIVAAGCFLNAPGVLASPTGTYAAAQITHGFMDGYNTMDTLAALNFGSIIALNIMNKGIKEEKQIVSTTVKAGWIAGALLMTVYAVLAYVGALSGGTFTEASNGATVLTNIVGSLFGTPGILLLAVIYVLSCLTTCIGLACSCAEFFASITKISYRNWLLLFTASSFVMSIAGLDQILKISVPILNAVYPAAMMLVLLGLFRKQTMRFRYLPAWLIGFTSAASILYALSGIGVQIPLLTELLMNNPLGADFCWVIPAVIGAIIGIIHSLIYEHSPASDTMLA